MTNLTNADLIRIEHEARRMRAEAVRDIGRAFGIWIKSGVKSLKTLAIRPASKTA